MNRDKLILSLVSLSVFTYFYPVSLNACDSNNKCTYSIAGIIPVLLSFSKNLSSCSHVKTFLDMDLQYILKKAVQKLPLFKENMIL